MRKTPLASLQLALSLLCCPPSILPQFSTGSAEQVLQAYLHALRAQDKNQLAQISISEHIPSVLDYRIVSLRGPMSDEYFQWEELQASYKDSLEQFAEIQNERIALEKELQLEFRKTLELSQRGEISVDALRRAKEKVDDMEEDVERTRKADAQFKRYLDQFESELLSYKLLFDLALNDISQMSSAKVEMHEAVVDMQLQSKDGKQLFKKYLVVLKRPIAGERQGRWLVVQLNDLSEQE